MLKEGDFIAIDGTTGEVIQGEVPTRPAEVIQVIVDGPLKAEDYSKSDIAKFTKSWENTFLNK